MRALLALAFIAAASAMPMKSPVSSNQLAADASSPEVTINSNTTDTSSIDSSNQDISSVLPLATPIGESKSFNKTVDTPANQQSSTEVKTINVTEQSQTITQKNEDNTEFATYSTSTTQRTVNSSAVIVSSDKFTVTREESTNTSMEELKKDNASANLTKTNNLADQSITITRVQVFDAPTKEKSNPKTLTEKVAEVIDIEKELLQVQSPAKQLRKFISSAEPSTTTDNETVPTSTVTIVSLLADVEIVSDTDEFESVTSITKFSDEPDDQSTTPDTSVSELTDKVELSTDQSTAPEAAVSTSMDKVELPAVIVSPVKFSLSRVNEVDSTIEPPEKVDPGVVEVHALDSETCATLVNDEIKTEASALRLENSVFGVAPGVFQVGRENGAVNVAPGIVQIGRESGVANPFSFNNAEPLEMTFLPNNPAAHPFLFNGPEPIDSLERIKAANIPVSELDANMSPVVVMGSHKLQNQNLNNEKRAIVFWPDRPVTSITRNKWREGVSRQFFLSPIYDSDFRDPTFGMLPGPPWPVSRS